MVKRSGTQIFPDSVLLNRIILKKVKGDTKDGSSAPSSISIKIEGIVIGDEYEVFSILTQVTEKLEENKLFYNVIIDSSEKVLNPEQGSLRFVLKCLLEPSSFS